MNGNIVEPGSLHGQLGRKKGNFISALIIQFSLVFHNNFLNYVKIHSMQPIDHVHWIELWERGAKIDEKESYWEGVNASSINQDFLLEHSAILSA